MDSNITFSLSVDFTLVEWVCFQHLMLNMSTCCLQMSIGRQWKELLDYNETIGFIFHVSVLLCSLQVKIKFLLCMDCTWHFLLFDFRTKQRGSREMLRIGTLYNDMESLYFAKQWITWWNYYPLQVLIESIVIVWSTFVCLSDDSYCTALSHLLEASSLSICHQSMSNFVFSLLRSRPLFLKSEITCYSATVIGW